MEYQSILFEKREKIAYITLNRPEVLNPINLAVLEELEAVFNECNNDREIHVILICGRGRAFSAGADLKAVKGYLEKPGMFRQFIRKWKQVANLIEHFERPVIAVVQGFALAGGLELVMLCDFVIASDEAILGDAHGNYGLVAGGGSTQRLPRLIGIRKAKELLYTGEFIDARTAEGIGLVNKVVPTAQLEKAAQDLANMLVGKSPEALRINKLLVNKGMQVDLDTALEMEISTVSLYVEHANDVREGLAAFEAKRKPNFNGT
jgi:enoyl-CoA hydratase/carnithine racemase